MNLKKYSFFCTDEERVYTFDDREKYLEVLADFENWSRVYQVGEELIDGDALEGGWVVDCGNANIRVLSFYIRNKSSAVAKRKADLVSELKGNTHYSVVNDEYKIGFFSGDEITYTKDAYASDIYIFRLEHENSCDLLTEKDLAHIADVIYPTVWRLGKELANPETAASDKLVF